MCCAFHRELLQLLQRKWVPYNTVEFAALGSPKSLLEFFLLVISVMPSRGTLKGLKLLATISAQSCDGCNLYNWVQYQDLKGQMDTPKIGNTG